MSDKQALTSDTMHAMLNNGRAKIVIRRLETFKDYNACVILQEDTWGKGFPHLVPASVLLVTQKIGGICAGAFDEGESLVGFVFGMAGFMEGAPVHWSDMLAVRPEFRGSGIGIRLKLFQRTEVLRQGVSRIYWTFDPLVSKNANLNLNRLGADIDDYVADMYPDEGSDLHRGLGMDRFVVVWNITSPQVEAIAAGDVRAARSLHRDTPIDDIPVVNSGNDQGGAIVPVAGTLPDATHVLIEVPRDIHAVRDSSPEIARQWRASTRHSFLHYLNRGYRVVSFVAGPGEERFFYLLSAQRGADR